MQDKKSKFDNPNSHEENKEKAFKEPSKTLKEGKKNFDYLQVHVARPNVIQKWQEISVSANLPERRSHCCSCIYKGRYHSIYTPQ